jgi:hypothetical protein
MLARYETIIAWVSIAIGLVTVAASTWAVFSVSVGR